MTNFSSKFKSPFKRRTHHALKADDCEFCRSMNQHYDDKDFFQHEFHDACARCSSVETEHLSLCSFCRHLRIQHLIFCCGLKGYKNYPILYRRVGHCEMQSSGCQLCQFISNAIETNTDFESLDWIRLTTAGRIRFGVTGANELASEVIYIDTWIQSDWMDKSLQNANFQLHPPGLQSPPELQEYIDWGKVRSWIEPTEVLEQGHFWQPQGFRVIDVQQNQLIKAPEYCEYFALSYVFGGATVEVPQEGRINRDNLPATIRDAMVACVSLGIQYLWVDQLCINQNDENDLQEQIDSMGLIYEHATCTLVALAGKDAYYGLPGVTAPRSWRHPRLQIGDVLLVENRPLFSNCVHQSTWSTRGWTFQEAIFSSQSLLFTEYGVYHAVPKEQYGQSESSPKPLDLDCLPAMDRFWEAHTHYTRRSLTYSSDAIRAFTGVLQKIHGNNTYYGLPIHNIYKAISWVPYISAGEEPGGQRDGFPSWSWASFDGVVEHARAKVGLALWAMPAHGFRTDITICTPYRPGGLGWCNDDFGYNEYDSTKLNHISWFALLAWLEGCIARPCPIDLSLGSSVNDSKDIVRRWPTYEAFWQDAFGGRFNHHVFSEDDRQRASSVPGSILVYTQTSLFHLEPSRDSNAKEVDFWIRANDGGIAGAITVPQYNKTMRQRALAEFILLSIPEEPEAGFNDSHPFNSIDYEGITGCPCRRKKRYILPAIAQAHTAACEVYQSVSGDIAQLNTSELTQLIRRIHLENLGYWHPDEKAYPFGQRTDGPFRHHYPVELSVMLIERVPETNIARRLGIGKIYLKKWVETRPEFKTIILE